MEKYAPNMMELASRDVVSRAEQTEINAGNGVDGCVFLDCRHLGEALIMEKLSQIREIGIDLVGHDMIKEPIPIRPGMHYAMGGIRTNIDGQTNLEGVYAAGECACVSVHGGNRLGANSLLDTIVFGERSGNHAAEASRDSEYVEFNVDEAVRKEEKRLQGFLDRPQNGDRIASVRLAMGESMNRNLAVYRNEEGMKATLSELKDIEKRYETVPVDNKGKLFNTDLIFALELGFMLDCATPIVMSALDRQDSRGAQARTDYPDRDDENWMKHLVIKRGASGPELSYAPVSITQWTPEERKY
jgi:succinate dehydrogenase / fumarate reductase flavoprotein subunit